MLEIGSRSLLVQPTTERVVDVLIDDRRVWSFHLLRDSTTPPLDHETRPAGSDGARRVRWPAALLPFLNGIATIGLADHLSGELVHSEEVHFGEATTRIAVVDQDGHPLGLDKSNRPMRLFAAGDEAATATLLDAAEAVLSALREVGVAAYLAYGTLLGAVREGHLLGHDSDLDLGYVSDHEYPVDVVSESYRFESALAAKGWVTRRYSGVAFCVDVLQPDGGRVGLDVFGGFFRDGQLFQMGEIGAPLTREQILPLGSCTLSGRPFPCPADAGAWLEAAYGTTWRTPDPAYHFETPRATRRRLTGWFRGFRVHRDDWDRKFSHRPGIVATAAPSSFARWLEPSLDVSAPVVELGCGRGIDALWLARTGHRVLAFDHCLPALGRARAVAQDQQLDASFQAVNFADLRSTLALAAALTRTPGRHDVVTRLPPNALTRRNRGSLWRLTARLLRAGGRAFVEVLDEAQDISLPELSSGMLRELGPEQIADELAAVRLRVDHREAATTNVFGRDEGKVTRWVLSWSG